MDVTNTLELKDLLIGSFKDKHETVSGYLPASVLKRKKEAFEKFSQAGFPTTRNEEYKYTNFASALNQEFLIKTESNLSDSSIQPFLFSGLAVNQIIFINGKFAPAFSKIADSNLELKELNSADSQILDNYFSTESYTFGDPFSQLNTALCSDGLIIRIPKGKVIEQPVSLIFVSDATAGNIFTLPRIMIVAEENSQATFIESFGTTGASVSFTNFQAEIILKENAVLDYYKLQNDKEETYQVNTTSVLLEGKSIFNAATITLNGSIVRNNLNVVLRSPYSEATFYGLYLLKDRQLVDNHSMVDHAVPNCQSNELYKGILDDRSTGVFNGKIFVKQDAQKTNAFQSNKNILLSRDAIMNTKPQLEIFADDVKCSHGATVGQLEEEPLFYLRARGLSEESARALLLIAFAQDVIDHIKIEPLKNFLTEAIEQRLSR